LALEFRRFYGGCVGKKQRRHHTGDTGVILDEGQFIVPFGQRKAAKALGKAAEAWGKAAGALEN
jgi:hypothetical protein